MPQIMLSSEDTVVVRLYLELTREAKQLERVTARQCVCQYKLPLKLAGVQPLYQQSLFYNPSNDNVSFDIFYQYFSCEILANISCE